MCGLDDNIIAVGSRRGIENGGVPRRIQLGGDYGEGFHQPGGRYVHQYPLSVKMNQLRGRGCQQTPSGLSGSLGLCQEGNGGTWCLD